MRSHHNYAAPATGTWAGLTPRESLEILPGLPAGACLLSTPTVRNRARIFQVPSAPPDDGALRAETVARTRAEFAPIEQAQGYLSLIRDLENWLGDITGYAAVSLQPNAGSQGELAGLLAIRGYLRDRGESGAPDRERERAVRRAAEVVASTRGGAVVRVPARGGPLQLHRPGRAVPAAGRAPKGRKGWKISTAAASDSRPRMTRALVWK